jgi:manganese/iron transport system permease protein
MISLLIEPLQFEFMRHALLTAVMMGVICAVVGSYLIVQHMGLLGDVIAHAVLPGLAIAYYFGIDIFVGAFISGTVSTLIISGIQSQSRLKVDVAMALVFSGFLALGIMLITLLKSKIDLHSFLFGDILAVTSDDVGRTFWITLLILIGVKLFYKELLFYTFNPLGVQAIGLPVHWIHLGLVAAITLAIIASMQAVGVVLVVSLLIGPASTAYLLVPELHLMMGLGALIGASGSVAGMYMSYYLNVPSGPAIVLAVSGLFILALLFSPSQGILTRPEIRERRFKIIQKIKQIM